MLNTPSALMALQVSRGLMGADQAGFTPRQRCRDAMRMARSLRMPLQRMAFAINMLRVAPTSSALCATCLLMTKESAAASWRPEQRRP